MKNKIPLQVQKALNLQIQKEIALEMHNRKNLYMSLIQKKKIMLKLIIIVIVHLKNYNNRNKMISICHSKYENIIIISNI